MSSTQLVLSVAPDVDLSEIAATIRAELQNEQKAGAALLHHAMAAGDALNLAQANQHQTKLTWKQWLRQNCSVSVRTAFVRQQLARHRVEIETEIRRAGDYLSIRAALRKVAKRSEKPRTKKPRDQVIEALVLSEFFGRASGAEIFNHIPATRRAAVCRGFLDALGADRACEVMSEDYGRGLRARIPAPKRQSPAKPKRFLRLVRSGTDAAGNPSFGKDSSFRH